VSQPRARPRPPVSPRTSTISGGPKAVSPEPRDSPKPSLRVTNMGPGFARVERSPGPESAVWSVGEIRGYFVDGGGDGGVMPASVIPRLASIAVIFWLASSKPSLPNVLCSMSSNRSPISFSCFFDIDFFQA
jgi:hypothetical protein